MTLELTDRILFSNIKRIVVARKNSIEDERVTERDWLLSGWFTIHGFHHKPVEFSYIINEELAELRIIIVHDVDYICEISVENGDWWLNTSWLDIVGKVPEPIPF